MSAFTRVFDALWRPSKDDGPSASAGILRGSLRSHLRMTANRQISPVPGLRFSHPNHFKHRCGFAFGPDLRQMTPAVEQAASRSEALAVTLFDSLPAIKRKRNAERR
jgi:hypothetical protein